MQGTKDRKTSVRLVLVDDNPDVLEEVGHLLDADFEVQGKFASGAAALKEIARLEPDIAIIDINLGDMSGFDVVRKLHRAGCRSKFIIMSVLEGQEMVRGAFDVGASGYVYKSRIAPDLVDAITTVASNGIFSPITGPAQG
jgi:DNA-binding NarL/FixJ family response regulator